jgi:LPXTG-motif cell wall-anchored protein
LATAVWQRYGGSNNIIQASTSQDGGAWSTPVNLSATTGGNAAYSQITVSSTGLATAVWARDDGSNFIIESSTSQNGGAWSTPVNLTLTGQDAFFPQITVSSTGLATAVWQRNDGSDDIIQASTSQNGGAWSTPVNLSAANGDASGAQVTVSSTGLATAVWQRYDGSDEIIQASTSQNGGAWSTPVNLSAANGYASDAQVTVSSTGLATAVWYRYDGSEYIIQSSTSQNGGAWSTPADLSATGGDAFDAQVTVSSTGLATAVWRGYDGSNWIIQSSTSQNGGAWTTPVNLSATGGNADYAQITVSSTGLATAVWRHGSNDIIQSSHILNPIPSQPTSTPTTAPAASLAKTGAEVDWLSLGSLIAVVAGAGFFALGRRKRTE